MEQTDSEVLREIQRKQKEALLHNPYSNTCGTYFVLFWSCKYLRFEEEKIKE